MVTHPYSRCLLLIVVVCMFSSCATYRQQSETYYDRLQTGQYSEAEKALGKNRLLKKKRNRLLYLLEKGRLAHLQGEWEESNRYLNKADELMEVQRNSFGDVAGSNLLNPMMKRYAAEDFEKYLVHYYKAINYLRLNNREEALVEARRITLRTYMQDDKAGGKNKYREDPFAFSLQGMIYEVGGDFNNAFIAYRNAVNVYLENNGSHYGTTLPLQLKKDLLRTASINGFTDELHRYEQLLQQAWQPPAPSAGGELVIFWESGSAPVKTQQDLFFSASRNSAGSLFFTDSRGLYQVPFNSANIGYNNNPDKLTDLRALRVAVPSYESRPVQYSHAIVKANGQSSPLEPAENIQELALSTLRERMLKELGNTLTRLAVKKLSEAAVRNLGADKKKSDDDKKESKKEKNTREALAFGLQLFNMASEKADTRNWQSLPNKIYYTRIPLQPGENRISLVLQGASAQTIDLVVSGDGGLQFRNLWSQ